MKIQDLLNQKQKKIDELKSILHKDSVTEEDLARAEELRSEVTNLVKQIDVLRETEKMEQAHSDYQPMRPNLPDTGTGTTPQSETQQESEPKDPIKSFYFARYTTDLDKSIKTVLDDIYGRDRWQDLRFQQLMAFNRYLRSVKWEPYGDDLRILKRTVLSSSEVIDAIMKGVDVSTIRATLVEADDVLGGYAVPPDYRNQIVERIAATARIRPFALGITTSRDRVQLPKATGGDSQFPNNIRVTWVDETPSAGAAETNFTYGMENIQVHTVMATVPVSRNLVEDAAYDLVGHLTRSLGDAFAIDEDNQFVNGDGMGKPQGILVDGANVNSLTEINTGNASALTWHGPATNEGLTGMVFALDAQYRDNARWLFRRSTAEAIARLQDAENRAYWSDADQAAGILRRYPIVEHEGMPAVAANAYPIVIGDFTGYYVVDRIGMTVERYLDSTTAEQNMVKYIARRRVGGKVVETWKFAVQKVAS